MPTLVAAVPSKPVVARRAPAPRAAAGAAEVKVPASVGASPRAFEMALIRLTGEAVDRHQALARTRQRYALGEVPAAEEIGRAHV